MQRIRDVVARFMRLPWSASAITAEAGSGGGVPSSLQATLAQLRYWMPTIADVAHIWESEGGGTWCFSLKPRAGGACSVSVMLRESGLFDLTIAGKTYEDCVLDQFDHLLPLIERITDGHVLQRHWASRATGQPLGIETIVSLGQGRVWRGGPILPDGDAFARDRHFLPYRRI
ncbi:MAG TPA: hypothetical protein PLW75_02405 [Hyphomicrobium sp.]|nr:hypothetical protein [Hyphomicrobium sp.]